MHLRNPFSQETKELFRDHFWCAVCSRSDKGREGHHIYRRVSNSPLNFSNVCCECHSHMGHSQHEQRELLLKTMKYLISQSYKPTDNDYEFLETIYQDVIWVNERL